MLAACKASVGAIIDLDADLKTDFTVAKAGAVPAAERDVERRVRARLDRLDNDY
jgi:hypothetical protein